MTMQKRLRGLVLVIAMSFAAYAAYADNVTVSTYYPSPFGSYQKLTTTDDTNLATAGGSVMIGAGAATEKLDVNGNARIGGDATVTGTATMANATVTGNLNLKDASSNTGDLQVSCTGTACYAVYAP